VFIVGTLTETKDVGEESEYWRGRVADPVGTFLVYAGAYQHQPRQQLRDTDPPAFVAVVGKPRPFATDTGGTIVSLQPEAVTVVDEQTRNRWVVETAHRTIERIERFDNSENEYAQLAREQYDLQQDVFRQDAIQSLTQLGETSASSPTGDSDVAGDNMGSTELSSDESTQDNDPMVREEQERADVIQQSQKVDDDVIIAALRRLGSGSPINQDRLITVVSGEYDVEAVVVEAAIEMALRNGRCVRSDVDELKPV
jgi:RPA family protein